MPIEDVNCISLKGSIGAFTSQGFRYFCKDWRVSNRKYGVAINSFDNIVPVKEEYKFDGWKDAEGKRYDFEEFDVAKARTYYAQWIRDIQKSCNCQY